MRTILLSPQQVLEYWTFIGPHIEKALRHAAGESTSYDWFKKTQSYDAFIICVNNEEGNTVNVTLFQFIQYEQHRSLHIVTTASTEVGKWKDYYYAHAELEKIALQNECKRIEMWGRKGWERLLPKLGYEKTYTVMSKEI